MRSLFRGAFAALVATLALGAVASASASAALPEVAAGKGEEYPINLASSQSTTAKISDAGEAHSCSGIGTKGSVAALGKAMSLTIEFHGCALANGTPCSTTEAGSGTESFTGSADTVYISRAKKEVGLLFSPNATTVSCGSVQEKVQGNILAPVSPMNTQTDELGLEFNGNGKGKPTYTKYENEKGEAKEAKLEVNYSAGYKEGALEAGAQVSPAVREGEALEIMAFYLPKNTELPAVSPATPVQGAYEKATKGTWIYEPEDYTYQWERCNAAGAECSAISGATATEYMPTAEDVGHTLIVKVQATNDFGSTSALSNATNQVESPDAGLPEFLVTEGGTFPDALAYANSTAAVRITDPVETITCEGITSNGSLTGAKVVSLTADLKGCYNEKATECSASGSEAGVVVFSGSGTPLYISKSEAKVGVLYTLNPTKEVTCGSVHVKFRGSIVAQVTTPVNTRTVTLGLSLQGNGKGKQTYTTYENGRSELDKASFEANFGTGYKDSALEATSENLALSASERFVVSE